MKPARVAAVHRLAGQAGGKKTKYLLGFSAPDQSDVLSDSVSFNKSVGKIGFFFIKNRENELC